MFCEDDMFYSEAMNLFQEAGHIATSSPQYANQTYKQVVYFDTEKTVLIDPSMSSVLEQALAISHLFDLGDDVFEIETGSLIAYYSVVLGCEKKNRSQMAHDAHFLLHQTFSSEISIILFKHEESVLLSVAGFDTDIILSDWYGYWENWDELGELIHVAQLSFETPYDFIADLIYLVAREYYKHPVLEKTEVYGLIPSHYFCSESYLEDADVREPIKDLIKRLATEDQYLYGDDYVEPITDHIRDMGDIDDELDMLSFELDMEEDIPDDIAEEDVDDFDDTERDEYEFEDVDPEIFDDPSLMLKWLDKGN